MIDPAPGFMLWAIGRAVRHPGTPLTYCYCPGCRMRFRITDKRCPGCQDRVGSSPEVRQQSPVPWYCSVAIIVLGIACWCLGAGVPVAGLAEAGRALVYIPLGNMYGLTLRS